jgi:hypothetical protein
MLRLTIDEELEIIEKRKSGIKFKEIRNLYNIKSNKTIYDIIKRNGRERIIPNRKNTVNDNYFEIIDSDEKAYWLGFLYADGYVRMKNDKSGELKLKLKFTDRSHIEKFRDSIKSTHKIIDFYSKVIVKGVEYTSRCSSISIYSTKMVSDLIKHGCVNNKTFKIKLPNISIDLYHSFIRGYFDGDGYISLKGGSGTCGITSNYDFLTGLRNYLGYGVIYKRKNIYDLVFYKKELIEKFYKMIYKDKSYFLYRKFEIFNKHLGNSIYNK